MGKNKVSLTTEQQNCINHKKGNLIVSASAGSGKTHVIIERIIRLVKDEHISVNKILAVTFTRLAADEMKEKLKKALIDEFNETGDLYFKEQLNCVASADISTIHSFLVNVLRSYFYKLNIDANFEVADERKSKKIMNTALSDIFEEIYEDGDERIIEVLSYYSSNRRDDSFKKTIMALYNFSNSEKSIEDIRQKSLKFSDEAFNYYKQSDLLDGYNEDKEDKVKKIINVLLDLTEKFKERYGEYKREENVLDFADLEFLAIELLSNEEILNDVKNRYEYIFIDEYQDVNAVQEEIVQKLSSNNAFMVGDSKQSIYGFRGCEPKFFIEKYNNYSAKNGGQSIQLNKNFRSAKNIVDAVNNVFSAIMTEDFGGFDYSKSQMVYGEGYGEYQGKAVIKCVEEDREQEKQTFSGIYSVVKNSSGIKKQSFSAEMLAIVDTIKKVYKSSYYDVKSGVYKQVEYDDICILTRSLKSVGEDIVKVLTYYDIPVSSSVKSGVSEYPEIKALHSAVKALTFMQSDIDLATVMLNFGDFDEDELVKIRKIGGYKLSFYEATKKASLIKDDLGIKVNKFISWFNEIRLYSEYMPASVVLRKIISESSWDLKLLATTFGKSKMARVERFLSEADFTSKPMRINEFKEYLDEFIEDVSFSEADGEGTVKLMTAHASKGLEFPIVIAVGLSKNFSSQDIKNQVLMDRDCGIMPKCYDNESMTVMETPALKIVKERYKTKRAIEEIRLFYVQLTRAKCELYIIVDGEISDSHDVEKVKEAKKQKDFLAKSDMPIENLLGSNLEDSLEKLEEEIFVAGNYENDRAVEIIKQNLSFNYGYQNATEIPLKSSVSKLNTKDKEYYKIVETFGESSSEKGTAYHRFLELSSFDANKVDEELQRFLDLSLISPEEHDLLDANKIKSILNIPIFSEIKDKKLYKERKFCNFVDAKDVGYDADEKILVQGIIDLIVEDEDGITLIDYKLTQIESDEDVIKKYNKQLLLYKKAIENCMNVKVKKVYIINILQEKIIELSGI